MAIGLMEIDAVVEWTAADETRPDVDVGEIPAQLSERAQRVLRANPRLRGVFDGTTPVNGDASDSGRAYRLAIVAAQCGLSKGDAARLVVEFYAQPGKKRLHRVKLEKTLRGWVKGREEAEREEAGTPQEHTGRGAPSNEGAPEVDASTTGAIPKTLAGAVPPFEVLPGPEYMRTSFVGAARLVPGIGLTAGGVGVLSGAGGDGKSVLAVNVVLGWTGDPTTLPDPLRPTRPLRVILFMVEDSPGMVQERLRMMLGTEAAPPGLLLFTRKEPMQFGGSKGRPLTKALDRLAVTLERHKPVDVVVFDPLVCLHAAEENSASEMMQWLTPFREVCRQAGAAVFIVHHAGWAPDGEDSRGRGSTAIRAWSDCELSLRAQAKSGRVLHRLNLVKCNFAPRWKEALTLQLDPITLRFDVVDEAGTLCPPDTLVAWLEEEHDGVWSGPRADLYTAIVRQFGCSDRTAKEAVTKAKQAGRLKDQGQRKPLEAVAYSSRYLP